MGRDAVVAGAENSMDAVDAADGPAAAAGLAFVAGSGHIVEVVAARTLHDVAAECRRVAQLRTGPGEQGAREQGVAVSNTRVVSRIGVADEGAEAQAAVGRILDPVERKLVDVDEPHGPL